MNKWNLIVDVAECTNCNLCTLAAMDEYVGNDFPGYSAPMPKHGHKWINILQKERGQLPTIDIAYVPLPVIEHDKLVEKHAATTCIPRPEDRGDAHVRRLQPQ